MTSIAEARLWGRTIGAVTLEDGDDVAAFQYDAAFARSRIEISPLVMPLAERVYTFPELARGKRDHFELADFRACARSAGMKRGRAESIVAEVERVVARWPDYADAAGVEPGQRDPIRAAHRLGMS